MLPFSDVLGWNFQGDLKFIFVALCDSLPSPCHKYAHGFATPAVSISSGETPSTENPPDAPLVVLPPTIPYEVLERVEDKKRGDYCGCNIPC